MRKINLVIICTILMALLLTGCGKKNINNNTSNIDDDFSANGDYVTVNSIDGCSFLVRACDYNREIQFNPLSILNSDMNYRDYKLINEYEWQKPTINDGIKIETPSMFYLNLPEESVYFVEYKKELDISLFYYKNQKVAEHSLLCILSPMSVGLIDFVGTPEYKYENGKFSYFTQVSYGYESDEEKCNGYVYIEETSLGQTVFFIGGSSEFSSEEQFYILSSFKESDGYESGLSNYDSHIVDIDYNSIALSGNFSDALSFASDVSDDKRHYGVKNDEVNYWILDEAFYLNPYYSSELYFDIFTLPEGENIPVEGIFEDCIPEVWNYFSKDMNAQDSENHIFNGPDKVICQSGQEWTRYSYTSLENTAKGQKTLDTTICYATIVGNKCIIFSLYNDGSADDVQILDNLLKEAIESISISKGKSGTMAVNPNLEDSLSWYGNDIATETDAEEEEEELPVVIDLN